MNQLSGDKYLSDIRYTPESHKVTIFKHFTAIPEENLALMEQTAANIGVNLLIWPHETEEDYLKFFEAQESREKLWHDPPAQGVKFSPAELMAIHVKSRSVPVEIIDDQVLYPEGMSVFWLEFGRLRQEQETSAGSSSN